VAGSAKKLVCFTLKYRSCLGIAAELIRIGFLCQLRLFQSRLAALRGEKKRKVTQKDILGSQQAIFKQLHNHHSFVKIFIWKLLA